MDHRQDHPIDHLDEHINFVGEATDHIGKVVDECQNHSADDAVRARAKGPCLERENWRPPSHPERRKKREEERG